MRSIARVQPMTTTRALRGPFDYRLPEDFGDGAVDVGSMLVVPFARRRVLGVVVGLAERSEVREEKLLEPLRALEARGAPRAGAARTVDRYRVLLHAPACADARPTARRHPASRWAPPAAPGRWRGIAAGAACTGHLAPLTPRRSPPRSAALWAPAAEVLEQRAFARRLLQGVTGSGKTEVYLRAATIAMEQGRSAIVLVPEIALTPADRGPFRRRASATPWRCCTHSVRPAQRYEQWRRLGHRRRHAWCVGPRSAVYAPNADLGLIVLDEEHDASYKHEGGSPLRRTRRRRGARADVRGRCCCWQRHPATGEHRRRLAGGRISRRASPTRASRRSCA